MRVACVWRWLSKTPKMKCNSSHVLVSHRGCASPGGGPTKTTLCDLTITFIFGIFVNLPPPHALATSVLYKPCLTQNEDKYQ